MAQSLAYLYHSNNSSTANGVAQHLTKLLSDCRLKGTSHLHSCYIGNSTTHHCLFTFSDSVGVYLKHTYGIPWIHYSFHQCGTFDCASAALPTASFCKTNDFCRQLIVVASPTHMLQLLKSSWNCLQLLKWLLLFFFFFFFMWIPGSQHKKKGAAFSHAETHISEGIFRETLDAWIVFHFSLED